MFPWKPGPTNVSSQMRITPYLLKMKWNGRPLYHHPNKGWGYLVPVQNDVCSNSFDDINWYVYNSVCYKHSIA